MDVSRQQQVLGKRSQKKFESYHVIIVGVGALGTVCSELIVRSGIKKMTMIDRDIVEESNLQRQTLFTKKDVGTPKASTAAKKLQSIGFSVKITAIDEDVELVSPSTYLTKNSVVIDCTDNLETRYLLNDLSVRYNLPLVFGTAIGTSGQAALLNYSTTAPCLHCFLPKKVTTQTCEQVGVLNTTTSIVAGLQCSLLISLARFTPLNSLIRFDNNTLTTELFSIKKKNKCLCCVQHKFSYLDHKQHTQAISLCGRDMYQVTPIHFSKESFQLLKNKKSTTNLGSVLVVSKKITLFPSGRALIKAKNKTEAKKLYAKHVGL